MLPQLKDKKTWVIGGSVILALLLVVVLAVGSMSGWFASTEHKRDEFHRTINQPVSTFYDSVCTAYSQVRDDTYNYTVASYDTPDPNNFAEMFTSKLEGVSDSTQKLRDGVSQIPVPAKKDVTAPGSDKDHDFTRGLDVLARALDSRKEAIDEIRNDVRWNSDDPIDRNEVVGDSLDVMHASNQDMALSFADVVAAAPIDSENTEDHVKNMNSCALPFGFYDVGDEQVVDAVGTIRASVQENRQALEEPINRAVMTASVPGVGVDEARQPLHDALGAVSDEAQKRIRLEDEWTVSRIDPTKPLMDKYRALTGKISEDNRDLTSWAKDMQKKVDEAIPGDDPGALFGEITDGLKQRRSDLFSDTARVQADVLAPNAATRDAMNNEIEATSDENADVVSVGAVSLYGAILDTHGELTRSLRDIVASDRDAHPEETVARSLDSVVHAADNSHRRLDEWSNTDLNIYPWVDDLNRVSDDTTKSGMELSDGVKKWVEDKKNDLIHAEGDDVDKVIDDVVNDARGRLGEVSGWTEKQVSALPQPTQATIRELNVTRESRD